MTTGKEVTSAKSTSSNSSWRETIRGKKPAFSWVVAAIVGALGISVFGAPDLVNAKGNYLRLAIPVFVIAVYAWRGYKDADRLGHIPLRNARVGQLADSVYFLGFLWTLWALIDSFVIHHLSAAEAVFRAFGYALVTTASGMFLRLALLQFTYSADDQVVLSEQQIEEEMRRFTKRIGKTITSLNSFQSSLDASARKLGEAADKVKDRIDGLEKEMATTSKQIEELPGSIVAKVESQIRPLVEKIEAKVVSAGESISASTKKVESAAEAAAQSIRTKTEKISGDIAQHSAEINERLAESSKAIKNATESLNKSLPEQMSSIVRNLQSVAEQIGKIRVSPDVIEEAVKGQMEYLKSLASSARMLEESIQELRAAIKDSTQRDGYRPQGAKWRWGKFWKH